MLKMKFIMDLLDENDTSILAIRINVGVEYTRFEIFM